MLFKFTRRHLSLNAKGASYSWNGRSLRSELMPGQVASGKWQEASGKWQVASGKWQVASGKWQVASGKWQVASGKWWPHPGPVEMARKTKTIAFLDGSDHTYR
jgi:2-amino-4-hydroxy-6-hydroxymethyldihydropteridine diphosphokinase